MNKLTISLLAIILLVAACSKTDKNDIIVDTTAPALTNPLTSFSSTNKFIAFGDTLPNLSINKGYDIFINDTNQMITAACGGIVSTITTDAANNNTITVAYKANSIYTLLYAGIKNVLVDINDTITAGTILGKLGSNREIYFAVIKNNTEVICPNTFASSGFRNSINTAIAMHNATNVTDSVITTCLVETLPK